MFYEFPFYSSLCQKWEALQSLSTYLLLNIKPCMEVLLPGLRGWNMKLEKVREGLTWHNTVHTDVLLFCSSLISLYQQLQLKSSVSEFSSSLLNGQACQNSTTTSNMVLWAKPWVRLKGINYRKRKNTAWKPNNCFLNLEIATNNWQLQLFYLIIVKQKCYCSERFIWGFGKDKSHHTGKSLPEKVASLSSKLVQHCGSCWD